MPRSLNNEVAGGFTHYRFIGVDEVAAKGSAASATIAAIGIPAGGVVKDVAIHGIERWTSGSVTEIFFSVGDGTDPDGFVAAHDYIETNASTGVTKWNSGAYFTGTDSAGATTGNVVNGKLYAAADTIDLSITTTDGNCEDMTGGLLFVGANILDPASYNPS